MVVARHPLAAAAGAEVLEAGGNAVDAAVAASFASGVVQPVANTIGGGGHIVVRPANGAPGAIDYRYMAPSRATSDMFEIGGASPESDLFGWHGVKGGANEVGALAAATPGSVAGLALAIERWGGGSLADALAPAIRLAEDGFEMDWYGSLMQGIHLDMLSSYPRTAATFLRDGGAPYRPRMIGDGDVFRQPALARTLRAIAADGPHAFYEGEVADSVEREIAAGGGILEAADLAAYRPRESTPPEVPYREALVLGPLNMSIIVPLVRMLAAADLRDLPPDDPRRLHLLVEILRRARFDLLRFYGDEEHGEHSWAELSSAERAEELISSIDRRRRTEVPGPDRTPGGGRGEGTVHLSAVDAQGTAVGLTETILGNWGCGVTTETGVLLNNGMVGFNPAPGHPNSIGAGKRPVSYMSPIVVLGADRAPALSLGASGGQKIAAAVLQVLANVLDLGMEMQDAIEAPRVDLEGEAVLLDDRFPATVEAALREMGHEVVRRAEGLATFEFANPCGIHVGQDGELAGGASQYQQTTVVGV
jgi:gamma-glutamyltranspeptidase/glutathione hydrolase